MDAHNCLYVMTFHTLSTQTLMGAHSCLPRTPGFDNCRTLGTHTAHTLGNPADPAVAVCAQLCMQPSFVQAISCAAAFEAHSARAATGACGIPAQQQLQTMRSSTHAGGPRQPRQVHPPARALLPSAPPASHRLAHLPQATARHAMGSNVEMYVTRFVACIGDVPMLVQCPTSEAVRGASSWTQSVVPY